MAGLLNAVNNNWAIVAAASLLALPMGKKRDIRGTNGSLWTSSAFNATKSFPQLIHCRLCNGSGVNPCDICNETGSLALGGFARKNTVRVASMVGTKWTSVEAIDGKWRHFFCIGKKGRNAKNGLAVLSSTCGPAKKRITLEVPVSQLKNRKTWEGGWTTLRDIEGGAVAPTRCFACQGLKIVPCLRCDGKGQFIL